MMNILFLEAYCGGSHRAFLDGWRARSRHRIEALTLPAHKWKWRMQTAAWVFAEQAARLEPDVIVATDMLNLAEFLGLTRNRFANVPTLLYFHENQYSYPPQIQSGSDFAWGVINSSSALVADALVFNSEFHRRDFLECWRRGNRAMPDTRLSAERIDAIEAASAVVPVGVDFEFLDRHAGEIPSGWPLPNPSGLRPCEVGDLNRPSCRNAGVLPATTQEPLYSQPEIAGETPVLQSSHSPPLILWNHRWEHDKQPEVFFDVLRTLKARGAAFRLVVCGQSFAQAPPCFEAARHDFAEEIVAFGFLDDPADYARFLWQADIVVSTAIQEFLGLSVIEAIWCGCYPLLPARLSYPDVLPAPLHKAHLYDSDRDLARRLERLLASPDPGLPFAPRQDFLDAYAWPHVAARLDKKVEGLGPL